MDPSNEKIRVREFRQQDARKVSYLVKKALKEVNSKDYSQDIIRFMCDLFSPKKIIEKSLSMSPSPRMETQAPSYSNQRPADRGYPEPHQGQYYKKKKREGFLSELFDFD